jgi:DNA-binding transcriptional MerR regulator
MTGDVTADAAANMTIDQLAAVTGSTTRTIRSLQTLGLLDHPVLRGRTGMYGAHHCQRLQAILHLQSEGFSLHSLAILFAAFGRGESLGTVLGLTGENRPNQRHAHSAHTTDHVARGATDAGDDIDDAELYGFGELQRNRARRRGRPLLAIVPTTVWDETQAS